MARHGDLAEQLLAWRNKPEGPIEPIKTNWTVVAANDNNPEDIAEMSTERSWRMTPSVGEIMAQVKTGDVERNGKGQIVRIGRLRFSDGTQTERAYCYGPEGKLVQYDARMPIGAMLGTRDNPEASLGGTGYTERSTVKSNSYFAEMFDVEYPVFASGGKRRNGKSYTAAESKAMLAEAIANTTCMPPVTVYPPSLPCGSERVVDSFLGMRKGKNGESGAIGWEDIAMSKVHREIWDETLATLSERDTETLDAAMEAKTLADIAPGGHRRSAERRGKRDLQAANDNLREAIKKAAA
ncbi:MAG: hypothetical protein EOS04_24345 [Mesorhizobium sp.]|nr:MAG: hypothetical protein EOR98_26685 [Mesorhizobium sp.]RWN73172.1 MAG: hypothetical protein EOS01_26870 [Mesorhizobium sp.]RWN85174.1 MAG: hypothetical protein EOS04_24345 [Mesorhizobium sp.]